MHDLTHWCKFDNTGPKILLFISPFQATKTVKEPVARFN